MIRSQSPTGCLLVGIAVACLSLNARALDPNRLLSQYVHQEWSAGSSFPGGAVNAIAQTADGYLWIGTDKGLWRFDGFTFSPVSFTPVLSASSTPILQLLTDANGQLWIRPQGADVVHQENGRFVRVRYGDPGLTSQITALGEDSDHKILLSDIGSGTFRLRADEFEKLATPAVLPGTSPPIISIAEGSDGRLWMGTLGAGLFVISHGHAAHVNAGLPDRKINCLLPISDRELWAGTDTGLYRWNGREFSRTGLPPALGHVQILSMLHDRDANIWVGTARGLLRINANGTSFSAEDELRGHGGINALFEDREGNLWVGGSQGLGRIRDSTFITYSPTLDVRFDQDGPIDADQQNRTWFAPEQGGLFALKDGRIQSMSTGIPQNDVVYSISGDKDGLWVGRQHGGLTHLQFSGGGVITRTYTQANGLAQNSVYAVYSSHDGSVWAGTLSAGVSKFSDQRFTSYTTANGLPSNTIYSILETGEGEMWFATPSGLSSLSNGQWRTFTTRDGLPSDRVNCLFSDSSGTLWSGTSAGLTFFAAGRFHAPAAWPEVLREPVFGLAEDKNGWLWIATSGHVLQVRRDKLVEGALGTSDIREYGSADGLLSHEGVNRSRSVVADSEGRIWFSLSRGISVVSPSHMPDSSPPAIAHIEGVLADGLAISAASPVRIPPSPKRIAITYTALSLASPDRIRFRYRVDGFDRNWSAPLATREAVYTNLGPDTYRFRVIASNSSGLWNGTESDIVFEVEPALWQTWWFRILCVVIVTGVIWGIYRLRVRHIAVAMNQRFDERLDERMRLARDFHDTLLQTIQGSKMIADVALDDSDDPTRMHQALVKLSSWMEQATVEGRAALHSLRASTVQRNDLAEALRRATESDLLPKTMLVSLSIVGTAVEMHPIVRDEIYLIGYEAVRNAAAHSRATQLDIELRYGQDLTLRIHDNGVGIPPQVLDSGRAGHFGLQGMRERTARIGGKFTIVSSPASGTEIQIVLAGGIIFRKTSLITSTLRSRLQRLFQRKI